MIKKIKARSLKYFVCLFDFLAIQEHNLNSFNL